MKFLALVFVFAFVAVQFSCSAPTPDEDKKEDAGGAPGRAAESAPPASEVKSEPKEHAVTPSEPPVPKEEKKA